MKVAAEGLLVVLTALLIAVTGFRVAAGHADAGPSDTRPGIVSPA